MVLKKTAKRKLKKSAKNARHNRVLSESKRKRKTLSTRREQKLKKKTISQLKINRHPYLRGYPTSKSEFETGDVIRFSYGSWKPIGEPEGWHHDVRPLLLVFWHGRKFKHGKIIEGINMNYMTKKYVVRLAKIVKKYPGIDGKWLYHIVKSSAPVAAKLGYRMYYSKVMSGTRQMKFIDNAAIKKSIKI
jgi:hypothetical protein